MSTRTVTGATRTYDEVHEKFLAWRPQTKQREGANGMTFDYLPVPTYKKYLNETVGAENWESDVRVGEKGVSVVLSILGVRKSASASIWPAAQLKRTKKNGETYYIDDPQPNEVEYAEARAFRRAAADHGILSYLWDKDSVVEQDATPAPRQTSRYTAASPKATNGQSTRNQTEKATNSGLSQKQIDLLTDGTPDRDGLHVPMSIVNELTPGFNGTASPFIKTLLAIKTDVGDAEYYNNTADYIGQALAENKLGDLSHYLDDDVDID